MRKRKLKISFHRIRETKRLSEAAKAAVAEALVGKCHEQVPCPDECRPGG